MVGDLEGLAAEFVREIAIRACLSEGGGAVDKDMCGYNMQLECPYQRPVKILVRSPAGDVVKYGCNYGACRA